MFYTHTHWGHHRNPSPSYRFLLQYITKTVPVDSPHTLQALAESEERNKLLVEQLASQAERCQQLTEKLHSSEEAAAGLRHKVRGGRRGMGQAAAQPGLQGTEYGGAPSSPLEQTGRGLRVKGKQSTQVCLFVCLYPTIPMLIQYRK